MPSRTPAYEAESRAGAVFEEVADWVMPAHFGDAAAEYRQAIDGAAVFDLSHHGKVTAAGPDAARFLHNLCTNAVTSLQVGQGCEAYLTTGQARIIAHALIYRLPPVDGQDIYWLDVGPGMGPKVYQHLDHFFVSEQVELADRTPGFCQLHVAGPRAAAVLGRAAGGTLAELHELRVVEQTLAGHPVQVRRHDALGRPGYDLVGPAAAAGELWDVLRQAGAAPAGLEAYDILHLEAGTPVNGRDIVEHLPQEVGRIERAVSFTKGCYIGQETVARIRTYGHVNRSLVGLRLAGNPPASGSVLYRDGKDVGQVTSAVTSPRLGAIALAYVRRGNETPGTTLDVGAAGGPTAEVVGLPFPEPR